MKKARSIKKAPRKSSAVKKLMVEAEKEAIPVTRKGPSSREVKNTIADTIERIYIEFGGKLDRANCEDKALLVTKLLCVGIAEQGLVKPPKLREREMHPSLCRACREA
jgi:hypothetical protein